MLCIKVKSACVVLKFSDDIFLQKKGAFAKDIFGDFDGYEDGYDAQPYHNTLLLNKQKRAHASKKHHCFLVNAFGLNLKHPSSLGQEVICSVLATVTLGPRMPFQLFSLASATPTTTESENVGEL